MRRVAAAVFLSLGVSGVVAAAITISTVAVRTDAEKRKFSRKYPELAGRLAAARTTPGLSSHVPQGIASVGNGSTIVISAYSATEGKPSIFMLVDAATGRLNRAFEIKTEVGAHYTGHVGGVAVLAGSLWTVGGGEVVRFALRPMLDARENGVVRPDKRFVVDSKASYVSAEGEHLWVGDFVHSGDRDFAATPHHSAKGKNAWVAAYRVDVKTGLLATRTTYKVGSKQVLRPDKVLFVREDVQGMAVAGSRVALTASFGSANSKLAVYRSPLGGIPFVVNLPDGQRTDGYVVDSNNHLWTIEMPAGAEDLEWNGRHLLTLFEGGSVKYRARWRASGGFIEDRFYRLSLD
ncbi:MAG: hypothetical protein HYY84_17140 [Deltaproteobacteria bacterium]|nr:hypothetical protein [Deltaproteobacteria bacterium]